MPEFLGIDTSNYTTSAAVFNSETKSIIQMKKLLPVKEGELGLRQSDAVFHHTRQLPEMVEGLREKCGNMDISAVSASVRPRNIEGSYMPCFLVGENVCRSVASVYSKPVFRTSHQKGHVLAALYSCGKLSFLDNDEPFLAFHVSGGTTDMLLCRRDEEKVVSLTEAGMTISFSPTQLSKA